jgi:tRNA(His) guanylyltransferase
MIMKDDLGDRMKVYEGREAQRRSLPRLPVVVRLDGKGFSKWTKGLKYPFDERLQWLRCAVTKRLITEFNAIIGYHQSDEITLILYSEDPKSSIYADGRLQKIVSHSASIATACWNQKVVSLLPEKEGREALFDSRAWEVPSLEEAANAILWREWDATKNSTSMAARSVYSHKEIYGKNGSEMQEMLHQKGINWNDYPTWAKRGTYMGRRTYERVLTVAELEDLPPKHNARKNPNMIVQRSEIKVLDMPIFSHVTNRVRVLLGDDPVTA